MIFMFAQQHRGNEARKAAEEIDFTQDQLTKGYRHLGGFGEGEYFLSQFTFASPDCVFGR